MKLTLITQLLEQISSDELLLENYGNLSLIDKGILKAIRSKVFKFDKPGAEKVTTIGRQSKVEISPVVPQAATILTKFMADVNKIAIVLKINNEQVLAIINRARLEGKGNDDERLAIVANEKLFKTIDREEFNRMLGSGDSLGKGNLKDVYRGEANLISMLGDEKLPYVRKIIKFILDKANTEKLDVGLMYITAEKAPDKIVKDTKDTKIVKDTDE